MTDRKQDLLQRYIEGRLTTLPAGSRLPTDTALAKRFGLSRPTVAKLMGRLARDGRLERVPGRGTFVGGEAPEPAVEMDPVRSSAESLTEHLLTSIRHGEIRRGQELPGVQYMARRFGVSTHTVSAAYRALREKGVITRLGRTHWVGGAADALADSSRGEMFVFMPDRESRMNAFEDPTIRATLHTMEDELAACGFVLQYRTADDARGLIRHWREYRDFPRGVLVSFYRPRTSARDTLARLARELLSHRKRFGYSVVVDTYGDEFPGPLRGARCFSRRIAAYEDYTSLARYIVASRRRWVLALIDQAHLINNAHRFWNIWTFVKFFPELKHLDKNTSLELAIIVPHPIEARREHHDTFERYQANKVEAFISKYSPVPYRAFGDATSFYRTVDDALDDHRETDLILTQKDRFAPHVLAWLEKHRKSAPRDAMLVSFDDDPEYYHLGLSRFEVDWERVGYLMAHAMIGDFDLPRSTEGYVRPAVRFLHKLTTIR